MGLIPYKKFGDLRLCQFLPALEMTHSANDPGFGRRFARKEIVKLDNWEFEDRLWVGEAVGFTEWLRLKDDPEKLRSLSLELNELPEEVTQKILNRFGLPLRHGMSVEEVRRALGRPKKTYTFSKDRTTYEFMCGKKDMYVVSCTIQHNAGLIYVVVTSADL